MSSKKISQNDPFVGVFSGDFTDGRFDSALALEEENPWEIVRSRRQAKTPDTARSAATLPVTGLQAKLQREREKAEKRARLIRGTKGEQGAQFLEQKTREFMKKSAVKTIAQEEKRIVTAAASRGIVFENAWAEGPPADVVSARAEAAAAVDDVVDLYDDRTTEQLVAEELGFSMEETSEEKQIRKERAIARALGAAKRDKALAQALDRERRKLNRISGQSRGIDPNVKAKTMRRLTDQAAKVKKQLNDKTDYLAANLPAETLLQERSWSTASRSELQRMAAQATIFKSSWRQKKEPPSGGAALASWIKSDLPATRAGVVTRADHNMMMRGIKDKRTRGVLDYLFEKIEKDPKYGEADRATYFRLMDEAVLRLAPLGRVAHQGQTQSAPAPPRHTMRVHVQGLPVEVDIREALYSAVPQLEELARLAPTASRVVQGLISVAALAVAVGDASTWDGAIASCVLFAQANADIFSTLAHSLFDKIRAKLSGFRHQADGDVTPPDVIYEEIDKMLMKNTIVYSVWDLFSCLSISTITAHFGMKWLGWESSMNFFNFSRTFLKERVSTDTFFSKLLGFFKTLVDRISAAIKNGDWHELFKDARTPELFVSEALCILECEYLLLDLARPKSAELFKAMRRAGQLPGRFAHQLSVFEKRELCRELADEGTAHVKQLQSSPTPPISTIVSITRLIERLRSEVYNLDNIKLNGQLRREPFSLFIVGVPGCGKSRLTGPMSFALGHSMGLPTGPENRFSVVPNANFFDGYHNQWCLIMDDIDQSAAKPAYGDITHADIVREMINSKSTQLEQADVDAKGTKFANFMASFYMTNFEDGRVENFVVKAAVMAHWRRFHYYIKMEVNPKVRTEAGRLYTHMEGLAAKAKEANITEDEYWTFIVHDHDDSKFSPTNAYTTRPFKEYKRFTTRSSFLTWLTKVFQEHHEQQDRELSAVDESDVCIHCHLPVEMHPKKTPCKPQHQAGTDGEPVLPWYARMMPELSGTYAKVVRAIDFRATVRGWIDAALDKVSLQALKVSRRLEDAKARAVRAKEETTEAALERLRLVNERVKELQLELKEHAEAAKGYMVQKWKDNAVALGVGMVIMAMTTPLLAMAYSRARKNRLDKVAHQSYASDGVDGTAFKLEQRAVRYNRVEVDRAAFVPTSPTMSFEQLVSAVAANVVKIHVAETSTYVWGVVWTTGVVLTVKHAFFQPDHRYEMAFDVRSMDLPEKKTFELGVWAKGMIQPYVVRVSTRGSPQETIAGVRNRDLALFFCPGIISTTGNGVRDFTQKSSVRAVSSQFDQASLVTQVTERKAETAHFRPGYCTVSREPSIHVNIPTFNGDCGAPLVAQTGKWRALVGLHGAGFTDTEGRPGIGQAEEVVGIEIDAVKLDTYAAPVDGVAFQSELLRKGGGDIRFKALPEKSSLWAALGRMTAPVQVCGTLDPPLSLSSNKSRIYRTPMAQAFYDLEAKHAGPVPAFHAPEFRGKMVGEGPEAHWQDPYTLSLEAMRNVNGDPDAWTWAINDYLEGVENLPGWDRVRPLTDYEAWAGIPGAVKSTAMSTSAGAPFFQKKRDLVTVVPGQYVDVDPEIVSHVTAIEANLRANKVVVVPCWYTLKDEELSTKKKLIGKVRVFNTVGAAFNLVAKKYLAPLAMIVHANRDFFESAIGMDLTSDEVSQFVNALQRFGPDGIAAADFENYDLRTCTEASLKKAAVWRRLAEVAGYSKEDVQFVYVLALSCVYTMNVVKNDVFLCVFKMSSGILETGDGNGITNSLAHRYAWYRFWRSRGKEVPPFRSGVALRVLGDDNARGVAKWAREWTIAESAKAFREIGHTLTPASKEGDFQPYGDISTITFMKRAFVQRELRHSSGYTRVEWMAPLEKKSIVKQVVMGMNSELSRFDYHATLLSNAAREAFLHGEEFYDEYVRAARAAARDAKIEDNAKLVLMPYQFWADAYLEKRFRLWDPEENPNTSL